MPLEGTFSGIFVDVLAVPVGDKALDAADRNRLALDAAHAPGFTLRLLRAHTAGQGRQSVGGIEDLVGGGEIALRDLGDEFGDADVDRAALDAHRLFAVQAALGFVDRPSRRCSPARLL
jgi:hypothetical protein